MPREMLCARLTCEEQEDRINGFCSVYCEDVDALQQIIDGLKLENADYHDANELYGKRITKLITFKEYVEEFHDEDYVLWRREEDATGSYPKDVALEEKHNEAK